MKLANQLKSLDWRIEKVFKVQGFHKSFLRTNFKGSYLKRFLVGSKNKVTYVNNLKNSDETETVYSQLPLHLRVCFDRISRKILKRERLKSLSFVGSKNLDPVCTAYRIKNLHKIVDPYLIDLINYVSFMETNPGLSFSLAIRKSEVHAEIFRNIGYFLYAGKTAEEIAIQFKLKAEIVDFINNLFFDYTVVPTNKVHAIVYFRQQLMNARINETEFNAYKVLSELGETGLKASISFHSLGPTEKTEVEHYLGSSMLENVIHIRNSVRTLKDAKDYNHIINNLGNLTLKRKEVELLGLRSEYTQATIDKIRISMPSPEKTEDDDALLLTARKYLKVKALDTAYPTFTFSKDLHSLDSIEVPTEVTDLKD